MGLLVGFINPSGGGGQFDAVESYPLAAGGTAATLAANTAYLAKVRVSRPVRITQMSYLVGTASGNVDLGVYQSNGTTLTRMGSTGSTAAAGSSVIQTIALTATVWINPGVDYYLGIAPDNGTVSIGRVTPNSVVTTLGRRAVSIATSFPLPATITLSSTAGSSTLALIYADAA